MEMHRVSTALAMRKSEGSITPMVHHLKFSTEGETMLDEFEAEYAQWLVDHPYIDDVEDAVAQILGPRSSRSPKYYMIEENVSCALVMCIRKGQLDESGIAQMRKDGADTGSDWLLDSVIAAGAELAEKWKAYRNK